ncbi:MAG: ThuA domain-containing protein [Chloroflexota bacterium]|nr:ThuA domain-containing protein [Chloroflexota bacterium]
MRESKRVLIILGGIYHDFEGFTSAMKPVLEANGYIVEATYDLDKLTTLRASPYGLVLSYTSLSRHREGEGDTHPESLTPEQTASLAHWVRTGGALLTVHCGTVTGRDNPAFKALAGGVFVEHPPQFSFMVYPILPEHPITEGVGAFSVKDEFYIQDYEEGLDVHMVAVHEGVAYPMVWSKQECAGRVAHIAMGHSEAVWELAPYQRLMRNTVDWLTRSY